MNFDNLKRFLWYFILFYTKVKFKITFKFVKYMKVIKELLLFIINHATIAINTIKW